VSLIIQDFAGAHNGDLHKTSARLIRGASWKKQRVVVIIPAGESIPAKVALSHWNLGFPPNNGVVRILAQGMEVGDAYSTAIGNVLAHPDLKEWEYLLTIEHDNAPPADGVVRLIAQLDAHPELACIGGLYFTKGPEGVAQIWGDPRDPVTNFRPCPPDPAGGLVECCGTGMGFNLFRLKMFSDPRMRRPWFRTLSGAEGFATQDLYFWGDARKYGYRCAIDCSVKVGHYDQAQDIMW
jgi:hypothetical protein